MRYEDAGRSDVGARRTVNEDSFLAEGGSGLWVVADGMGGHEYGEWASAVIVNMVGRTPLPGDFEPACHIVAEAIHAANAAIYREGQARGTQMGSTVVALLTRGVRFAIFWVGDSRAYLWRGGEFIQLTRDHTQVQALLDRGLIDEEAAASHPMGHVLARAVGVEEVIEVDVVADSAQPGDIFLLCSDGLTGPVEDALIAAELAGGDIAHAVERLISLTLERGAPDNVTVIAVRAQEPTHFAPGAAGAEKPAGPGDSWSAAALAGLDGEAKGEEAQPSPWGTGS